MTQCTDHGRHRSTPPPLQELQSLGEAVGSVSRGLPPMTPLFTLNHRALRP